MGGVVMTKCTDYISPSQAPTLAHLFLERINRSPDASAYQYFDKESFHWQNLSWREMLQLTASYRQALLSEGLATGNRVALIMNNSPEWVAFEQAALSLGLLVVPLYSNDRAENISYILEHTSASLLFCQAGLYQEHLHVTLRKNKQLQRIVTNVHCPAQKSDSRLRSLNEWLPSSASTDLSYTPVTSETATIVYTSGTTGHPKGVMLSHKNILENSYAGAQCMEVYPEDKFLSFLPLSHMLERTAGYYLPMMAGATISFARSIPELSEDLIAIRPTILVSVPRIFEKVYATVKSALQSKSPIARKLFQLGVDVGWATFLHKQQRAPRQSIQLLQPLLDPLVGRKVRNKMGGRLRIIISGGAPLSSEISRCFIGLGLPIYQGYGLTETSPIVSVNRPKDNRPEGVGKPLPGVEVRIGNGDELLVRGNCIMQGYWENKEATSAAISTDNWLHTGDKAALVDGHIKITGRLKEIIVLSNGEKISPTDIEQAINLDPLFENSLVLGECRPFLTLLTVLNSRLWQELARELNVPEDRESLRLPQVKKSILLRIEKRLTQFPGFVFIKDVALSLTPWSVDNDLLTPTLKIKRKAIEKHMEEAINQMYSSD